jgi:hypothetical protein
MAGKASEYHRGDMDIHEQVSTFHLIMGVTKWGSLALATTLLTLVLWFCTGTGFLGAVITGGIVLTLGIFLLRSAASAGH